MSYPNSPQSPGLHFHSPAGDASFDTTCIAPWDGDGYLPGNSGFISDDAFSNDADANVPPEPAIVATARDTAGFVETLGNVLCLNDEERVDLKAFGELARYNVGAAMIYQQATLLRNTQHFNQIKDELNTHSGILRKIKSSLVDNIGVSKSVQKEITSAAKVVAVKPKRIDFSNEKFVEDMEAYLRARQETNGLAPYFDEKASSMTKQNFKTAMSHAASYAKQVLRGLIKAHVLTPGKYVGLTVSLTEIVQQCMGKREKPTTDQALWLLTLRSLARQRADLFADNKKGGRPTKRRCTEDNEARIADDDTPESKGDFWMFVTAWFEARIKEWGSGRKDSVQWKQFYSSCVKEEGTRHPEDKLSILPLGKDTSSKATSSNPTIPAQRGPLDANAANTRTFAPPSAPAYVPLTPAQPATGRDRMLNPTVFSHGSPGPSSRASAEHQQCRAQGRNGGTSVGSAFDLHHIMS